MNDAQSQFAADAAALVNALQVPVSMPGFIRLMGPAAFEAWQRLMVTAREGAPSGWTNAADAERAYRAVIADRWQPAKRDPAASPGGCDEAVR